MTQRTLEAATTGRLVHDGIGRLLADGHRSPSSLDIDLLVASMTGLDRRPDVNDRAVRQKIRGGIPWRPFAFQAVLTAWEPAAGTPVQQALTGLRGAPAAEP